MRRTLVTAISLISAAAMMSGAGLALASTRPDSTKHENFRVIGTNEAATSQSVIATGSFTSGGHETLGRTTDKVYLYHGTFKVSRHISYRTPPALPHKCVVRVTERGTYTLSHGTGRYSGIRGGGGFTLRETVVLASTGSAQCGKTVAFQLIMYESGTVNK